MPTSDDVFPVRQLREGESVESFLRDEVTGIIATDTIRLTYPDAHFAYAIIRQAVVVAVVQPGPSADTWFLRATACKDSGIAEAEAQPVS